ncbi:MAG: hypothetical protein Q9160_007644 [Pyrenula sp. 1 TL-2023]
MSLMARMIVADREYVKGKYKLHKLKEIEDLVASAVEVNIPFNSPVTGYTAFTHKAGIHAKAILNDPSTEIINPADFGLTRYVHFASRLTGWNSIKSRAQQLNLHMTDAQYKECTAKMKALSDIRPLKLDDGDSIIRAFYHNIKTGGDTPLLSDLSTGELKTFEAKEEELQLEPEKRELDRVVEKEVEVEKALNGH